MATVSVIIPTYERPEYLDGAVSSALNQQYDDMEVVIVDDGSPTDYATEVAATHSGCVRCVVHDENQGLSAARNTGIEAATGEFVAFLDDDDRWAPSKIERQIEALESSPDAAIATCLLASMKPDGTLVRCDREMPSGDLSDIILLSNAIGTPSRVIICETALEETNAFDEVLSTKQDWDLYIRLCQKWEVVCVSEHLCYRTIHDNMSNDPEVMETDLKAVIDKHEQLLRDRGRYEQALASYFETVGFWYLENDELSEARRCLACSLSFGYTVQSCLLYISTLLQFRSFNPIVELKRWISRKQNCSGVDSPPEITNR